MTTKKERIVLVTLFAVFFLSSIAWAVDCPIPDTGQTKCYDYEGGIPCPQPGQPFYGQDAQYNCNPQSYTSLAGGIMVKDNVTGLVWENKTDDGSIHDKDNMYDWYDAQDVFIATLNSQNFGGYSDWRLPTIMELAFLVDRDRYRPSINTTYFPNIGYDYFEGSSYWSSTTFADAYDPDGAWYINFSYGGFDFLYMRFSLYVRAVRAGQGGSFDSSTTTTISGSTTSTISGSTTTTVQPCPTEALYGEYSEQTELLRYIRDNVLDTTPEGQELIRLYYELSPTIVRLMEADEGFKEEVKEMIDEVVGVIEIGVE